MLIRKQIDSCTVVEETKSVRRWAFICHLPIRRATLSGLIVIQRITYHENM